MKSLGLMLVIAGAVVAVLGLGILAADKLPFLGRLPGDFHVRTGRTSVHIPLATCLILSLLLTLILNLALRLFGR